MAVKLKSFIKNLNADLKSPFFRNRAAMEAESKKGVTAMTATPCIHW